MESMHRKVRKQCPEFAKVTHPGIKIYEVMAPKTSCDPLLQPLSHLAVHSPSSLKDSWIKWSPLQASCATAMQQSSQLAAPILKAREWLHANSDWKVLSRLFCPENSVDDKIMQRKFSTFLEISTQEIFVQGNFVQAQSCTKKILFNEVWYHRIL